MARGRNTTSRCAHAGLGNGSVEAAQQQHDEPPASYFERLATGPDAWWVACTYTAHAMDMHARLRLRSLHQLCMQRCMYQLCSHVSSFPAGLAGRSGSLTASRGGPAGGSGAAAAPASPRGANPSHVADAMKALTQQLYSLLQERQRYNNDAAAELAPAGARAAVALPAGASSVPKSWLRADGTEERGGAGSEEPQPQRSMLPVLASRKEELGLLQRWLEEQLQQVLGVQAAAASSSARGTADASSTPASAELADAAVRLFSVAAEELRRQVSSESRERGEMLGAVTDALCSAVAAQVGLAAEHRLAAVQQQYAAAVAAATAATKSAEAAKRAQSGSAEEGGAGPGAALKLSQAVWTAEELTQKLRMTDLTLQVRGRAGSRAQGIGHPKQCRAIGSFVKTDTLQASLSLSHRLCCGCIACCHVADALLLIHVLAIMMQGEVTRRQEAERQLDRAQLLLARTEHEWLRHRATNKAMEEQMGDSKLSVDKVTCRDVRVLSGCAGS